jgi:hypothetical protein
MKVNEILNETSASDKLTLVNFKALKKKKNNPKKSKTTRKNTFIDVFGGMAGLDAPGGGGSINPTAQSV